MPQASTLPSVSTFESQELLKNGVPIQEADMEEGELPEEGEIRPFSHQVDTLPTAEVTTDRLLVFYHTAGVARLRWHLAAVPRRRGGEP